MAVWLKFLADVDYRHASRAVTAYKAGMTVYTPDHIAQSDQLRGKVEEVEKPGASDAIDANEGDGRRVYLTDGFIDAETLGGIIDG